MSGLLKRQRPAGTGRRISNVLDFAHKYTPPHTTRKIVGQFSDRGPRVIMTLADRIDGHVLAQVELQPDKAEVLRAAEVLGCEAATLEQIALVICDGETLGPMGLDCLRRARIRIADAKAVLE
jgi:hypothetical protein